jgi:hypothetical protein
MDKDHILFRLPMPSNRFAGAAKCAATAMPSTAAA